MDVISNALKRTVILSLEYIPSFDDIECLPLQDWDYGHFIYGDAIVETEKLDTLFMQDEVRIIDDL